MENKITPSDQEELVNNKIQDLSIIRIDETRIRVELTLYENHSKPNIDLVLSDATGQEISRSILISPIEPQIQFTMHIRQSNPVFPLHLACTSYLEEDHESFLKRIVQSFFFFFDRRRI
ncbi:MAG: hypothetical protein NTZ74_08370 [Chloroflexi bacterium]|nr:hypothetical protein [Chloroflexota bacterium]